MAGMVGLLGMLSALFTLVGVYKFVDYFYDGGSELALLLGVSMTAVFLLLFEQILFLMGIAAILSPVALLIYLYGIPPLDDILDPPTSSNQGGSANQAGGTSSSTITCKSDSCDYKNDPSNMFCDKCGYKLK